MLTDAKQKTLEVENGSWYRPGKMHWLPLIIKKVDE